MIARMVLRSSTAAKFHAAQKQKGRQCRPLLMRGERWNASARALNGDELLADAAAAGIVGHRNGSGDVVLVDLVERGGLGELARLAIGGRGRRAAMRAGGEAPVDAVAVGRVGDDEDASLS